MIYQQYYRAHNIREGIYGPLVMKAEDTEILKIIFNASQQGASSYSHLQLRRKTTKQEQIIFYWKSEGTIYNKDIPHVKGEHYSH